MGCRELHPPQKGTKREGGYELRSLPGGLIVLMPIGCKPLGPSRELLLIFRTHQISPSQAPIVIANEGSVGGFGSSENAAASFDNTLLRASGRTCCASMLPPPPQIPIVLGERCCSANGIRREPVALQSQHVWPGDPEYACKQPELKGPAFVQSALAEQGANRRCGRWPRAGPLSARPFKGATWAFARSQPISALALHRAADRGRSGGGRTPSRRWAQSRLKMAHGPGRTDQRNLRSTSRLS